MSNDIHIGDFTINVGYRNVFLNILSYSNELDGEDSDEHYGLVALSGLTGWQAIEVFKDGFNKLNEYGREPEDGESDCMLRMGLMLCACIRQPYAIIGVY